MPAPTTYPSDKQFLGLAKEVTPGTAVAPTWTFLVEKFEAEDKPTFLLDKAMRGSMVEEYGMQQGVRHSEWSMSGPWFGDGGGFLLNNILGDMSESGTYTGSGTTTLSAGAAAGATSISTALSITNGTRIQIGTGANAEVVVTSGVPSGAGPFTIPVPALRFAHLSAEVVQPVTTPYSQAFAVLNSGLAQPGTLSFTDWQGLPATNQARVYAGACLSELSLKGNAETELVTFDAKGLAWASVIAAAIPTAAPTAAQPIASWRTALGLGGVASGGTQDKTVGSWEIKIMRKLKAYFTGQNSQDPFIIQRGAVTATGKLVFTVPADESKALLYMLNNTQPQFQWTVTNGGAGAALLGLTVDVQAAGFDTAKINRGAEAVGYDDTFKALANTTNAGQSGGYSPVKVTLQNAVAAGTF